MSYIKPKIAFPENPCILTCDVVLPNERYVIHNDEGRETWIKDQYIAETDWRLRKETTNIFLSKATKLTVNANAYPVFSHGKVFRFIQASDWTLIIIHLSNPAELRCFMMQKVLWLWYFPKSYSKTERNQNFTAAIHIKNKKQNNWIPLLNPPTVGA